MKEIDISKLEKGMTFPSYRQLCMAINQPIYSKAARKKQMKEWRENYFDFTESRSKSNSGGHTITIKSIKTQEEVKDNVEHITIPQPKRGRNKYLKFIEPILMSNMNDNNEYIASKIQLYRSLGFVGNEFGNKIFEGNIIEKFTPTPDLSIELSKMMSDFKEKVYYQAGIIFGSSERSMMNRKLLNVSKEMLVNKINGGSNSRHMTLDEETKYNEISDAIIKSLGFNTLTGIFSSKQVNRYYSRLSSTCAREMGLYVYQAYVYKYIYDEPYPTLSEEAKNTAVKKLNDIFIERLKVYIDNTYKTLAYKCHVPESAILTSKNLEVLRHNYSIMLESLVRI